MLSALRVLLGKRSAEPIVNGQFNAAGSDLFVHLGAVTALTGNGGPSKEADGGTIRGNSYKSDSEYSRRIA
jgi:hypothetical protein